MGWLHKVELKKAAWRSDRGIIQLLTGTFSVSSTAICTFCSSCQLPFVWQQSGVAGGAVPAGGVV